MRAFVIAVLITYALIPLVDWAVKEINRKFNRQLAETNYIVLTIGLLIFLYFFLGSGPSGRADAPYPWQVGFQDPATELVVDTLEFYDDLCVLLVAIAILVAWLIGRSVFTDRAVQDKVVPFSTFRHQTKLEVWWTLVPTAILVWIAIPSLSLLYSGEEGARIPDVTFRAIGRQWYWTYEFGDYLRELSVQTSRLPLFQEDPEYHYEDAFALAEIYEKREWAPFGESIYKLRIPFTLVWRLLLETPLLSGNSQAYSILDYWTSPDRVTELLDMYESRDWEPVGSELWTAMCAPHLLFLVGSRQRWVNLGVDNNRIDAIIAYLEEMNWRSPRRRLCVPSKKIVTRQEIPALSWDSTIAKDSAAGYIGRLTGILQEISLKAARLRHKNRPFARFPRSWVSNIALKQWWNDVQYRASSWLLRTRAPLIVPSNLQIRLLATATDVIHSWTIPSFGIKIDACPGRLNQVIFSILRSGTFFGQCSEICGINHAFMPIEIRVVGKSLWDAFRASPAHIRDALQAAERFKTEPVGVVDGRAAAWIAARLKTKRVFTKWGGFFDVPAGRKPKMRIKSDISNSYDIGRPLWYRRAQQRHEYRNQLIG